MTRHQKEECALDLYQKGMTIRQDFKSKSNTTQVINLFSEGKNLVGVVIALDPPPDEVREMHTHRIIVN